MPTDLEQWTPGGQTIVTGGVSSGLAPDAIRPDQLAWARNINLRDGKPETPWGLVERAVLPFGRVQAIKPATFGEGQLVMSLNGRIYKIVPDYSEVEIEELTVPFPRAECAKKSFMVETADSFIIQDGISAPLIYNGRSIRKAAADEITLGEFMANDGDRVWFTIGKTVNALNIITGVPDSELKFTEAQTFQGGGAFGLPSKPTGLAFMPSSDGTTTFGVLMVFGLDWTIALRANIPDRSQWLSTPGFKTEVFDNIGCASNDSIITSNSDMYWRDGEGEMRNMRQAVSDYDTAGSTSVSREISRLVDHESPELLNECSGIVFRNKMIQTASPFFVYRNQVAYRDMFSLDFTPIGTQGEKRKPVYDGERDGIFVTNLVTLTRKGQKRAFAISKDEDGTNRLWEIVPEERNDIFFNKDGVRTVNRIESDIQYRSFDFESNLRPSIFQRIDFWLSGIEGEITGTVYYRRNNNKQWIKIDDFDFCTLVQDFSQDEPHVWKHLEGGRKDQVISRTPPALGEKLKGHSFEFRFIIKGVFRLEKVLAFVADIEVPVHAQPRRSACEENEITLVGTEYRIPVALKTLRVYTDQNGDSYADQNGVEYQG